MVTSILAYLVAVAQASCPRREDFIPVTAGSCFPFNALDATTALAP